MYQLFADYFLGCGVAAGRFVFGDHIDAKPNFSVACNAVDAGRFHPDAAARAATRAAWGITDTDRLAGFVGRLNHQKNPLFLMEVFATVPVLAAVSYILPLFVVKIGPWANDIGPGWLKKLDDLLTCRISLAWAAYRVFDIKIAGQMLPDWPALDNIFVYLLYLTGPVMVVLVCALMMTALYGYARRGQWQAVACLLVMLAYGYMESQVTHLTSDPALLLLCGAVFALPRERWLDE